MQSNIETIRRLLQKSVDSVPDRIAIFFKTGKGEYAEHDAFLGVSVPTLRKIAKGFKNLTNDALQIFLESKFNEERLLALLILVDTYKTASCQDKEKLYQFYMSNLQHVNNWNLVDASAHLIIGAHLHDKDKGLLFNLAESEVLWERRIAIVSTWYFIRNNDLEWTFKLARVLLEDQHDLIHKAVGWMLREAGKRSQNDLVNFLDNHSCQMARTTLRYAIEKFPESLRKNYLLNKSNIKA